MSGQEDHRNQRTDDCKAGGDETGGVQAVDERGLRCVGEGASLRTADVIGDRYRAGHGLCGDIACLGRQLAPGQSVDHSRTEHR